MTVERVIELLTQIGCPGTERNIATFKHAAEERLAEEEKYCSKCDGKTCLKPRREYEHHGIYVDSQGQVSECPFCCPVMQDRTLAKASGRAGVPDKYRSLNIEDYEKNEDNEQATKFAEKCIEQFEAGQMPKAGMYLHGGCGAGKSMLSSIVLNEYLANCGDSYHAATNHEVCYENVPNLLERFKSAFNGGGPRDLVGYTLLYLHNAKVVVLDELGAESTGEWAQGILYDIINGRYDRKLPTFITSNFSLKELAKRFCDNVTGERIISRLKEMCVPFYLGEEDRRVAATFN